MTASTQGLTAPGFTAGSIPAQPGITAQGPFAPGFQPQVGTEQIFGFQTPFQPYGSQQPYWLQAPYSPYGITTHQQAQQAAQALAAQILPAAQQVVLPQVLGAIQQLTMLIAQFAFAQLGTPVPIPAPVAWTGQVPTAFASPTAWAAPMPIAMPTPIGGVFGQVARPGYPY